MRYALSSHTEASTLDSINEASKKLPKARLATPQKIAISHSQ